MADISRVEDGRRLMTAQRNRQVWLKKRPTGIPQAEHFDIREAAVPEIVDGQFLVRNQFLSADPAMRGWILDASNYWPQIQIGDVMRAFSAGEIVASRHPDYAPGQRLMGLFGWQDYAAADPSKVMRRVEERDLPLSASLGVLGLNGLTAYFGLLDVGRPRAGDTVVVSTAAGAVGSCVGQIAKIKGARTVGIAGGAQKTALCRDIFRYDFAIDYKVESDLDAALGRACPQGVNVYFDNTSGAISDAVVRHLAVGARIAICGTASFARWEPWPSGPRPERHLLVARASMQGFLTTDYAAQYEEAIHDLVGWLRSGVLVYREDRLLGIENAPGSIARLYSGANEGKTVIQIRDET
jgi:NADPH-dependent curcumin reductase CurA